jgi:ABC-type glycerol-3-phosphate transport system substrate-binding protein
MGKKQKDLKSQQGMSRREFLKGATALAAGSITPRAAAFGVPALLRQAKQVVEMWMWETPEQWLNVQELSGLNEAFPDVEFKWTSLPYPDLHQKAVTSLAAGIPEGLPSIFRTHNPFYRPLVNTQSILEVTDSLEQVKDDIFGPVWEEGLIDGKHYHVPDDIIVNLLGYRTDIFEAAGLPIDPAEVSELLATYDDLLTVGATIKEKTGASIMPMSAGSGVFLQLVGQNTSGFFDADGNVIFDSDAHVEAAMKAKEIWDSGLTVDDSGPQGWQLYKDGQIAARLYPNYLDFVLQANAPETAGMWRVAKLPQLNSESHRSTIEPGLGLVIPAIIPEEQQALALEVALYMKLTEQATVAHMKTFPGAFVSYLPGLQAMVNEPSPVLNEQFTFQVFLDAFAEDEPIARLVTSMFYSDAGTAANDAMFRVLTENADPAEALKTAADSVRQLQDSRGMK